MPRADRHVETPIEPGTRIGRYEIVSVLGEGGMGIVYRARDTELGRFVALKSPRAEIAGNEAARRRFLREARAGAALDSPYIVSVHEVFESDGRVYHASDLVEGPSLRRVLEETAGPLPVDEAIRHAEHVALALDVAHEKKLLHRDIKPENVLLSKDGRARLTDFGLAGHFLPRGHEESATTQSDPITRGAVVGTRAYMSPEQLLGKQLDVRSDVFALGVLLYELVTGRRAFTATDRSGVEDSILHTEPTAIARLNYEAPSELERIVRKAMAKDPRDRYQSAREMATDLRVLRRSLEGATSGWSSDAAARPARVPRGRLGAALVVVAALGAVLWRVAEGPAPRPFEGGRALHTESFVTWPSNERDGRISPDGKWIAFLSDRDGQPNVWVQALGTSAPHQVTAEEAPVLGFAWAPSGDRIAYLLSSPDAMSIKVVGAPIGSGARLLTETDVFDPRPRVVDWATTELYVEDGVGLWSVDMTSRLVSKVLDRDASYCANRRDFDVSADGTKLVFRGFGNDRHDIWSARRDGTETRRITDDAHVERTPMWLGPDAARVLYVSDRAGADGLWIADASGRHHRQVPFATEVGSLDDAARDGTVLSVGIQIASVELWGLDRRSSRARRLGGDTRGEFAPSLARDGRTIAFQRARPAPGRIASAVGSPILVGELDHALAGAVAVVDDGFAPALSPSGRYVAYFTLGGNERTAFHVRVYDRVTGRDDEVTRSGWFCGFHPYPLAFVADTFAWDPKERFLAFVTRTEAEAPTLCTWPVPGAPDRPPSAADAVIALGDQGAWTLDVRLTSSGERAAVIVHDADRTVRLVVANLNTGDIRTLDVPLGREDSVLGWRRGDRRLVLARLSPAGHGRRAIRIEQLDVDAATPTSLGEPLIARAGSIRFDPDSDTVFATGTDDSGEGLFTLSLGDGAWRRAAGIQAGDGVTVGGARPASGDRLIYVRQEEQGDIWIATSSAS